MALIFLGALITFTGSSFGFRQVKLVDFIASNERPPIRQIYGSISFGGSAGVKNSTRV